MSPRITAAIALLAAGLIPGLAGAHETWILTPEQLVEYAGAPVPEIYTTVNATNLTLFACAAIFIAGWVTLNFTGARELFPDLRIRLASYGDYAALSLRLGLAVMFLMAAWGLNPRFGTAYLEAPTLMAPDMELRSLHGSWGWLAWVQAGVGLALLLGIYTRAAAALTLGLCALSAYLFPAEIWSYLGIVAAGGIYLLMEGGGAWAPRLPVPPGARRLVAWLDDQPRARAQWLLRVLSGLTFLYLGLYFKVLNPQYMYALVTLYEAPTFGFEPETFVLLTAVVETTAGVLMLAGVLMRALSLVLLSAFVFFSFVFGEGILAHSFAYGILAAYLTNGCGRWRRPIARDRAGSIVVAGGGLAAIHCAMRLERLLGRYTNVRVTLVDPEPGFVYRPLLPEVVAGSAQPGNVVNSVRRICPRTRLVQGRVDAVDTAGRRLRVALPGAAVEHLDYDALVLAPERRAVSSAISGLREHGLGVFTVTGALRLRQHALDCLRHAEGSCGGPGACFVVVGGGVDGSAIAAALRELLDAALVSHPGARRRAIRVLLFEQRERLLPGLPPAVGEAAARRLQAAGVEPRCGSRVAAVTPGQVVLATGERIDCHAVVAAVTEPEEALRHVPGAAMDGRLPAGEDLRLEAAGDVLAAGDAVGGPRARPLPLHARRMGRRAAYNAWAITQERPLRRWRQRPPRGGIVALGRRASIVWLGGWMLGGPAAWSLSRLRCVLALPGLERNLRLLFDWLLAVPFRNDIAVVERGLDPSVSRAHFEPGDTIVREGDSADAAYILTRGEVEVLAGGDETRLGTMGPGDCFGEIALLAGSTRTATVRCLTPVDVTLLHGDQFRVLAEDSNVFGAALRAQMTSRLQADPRHALRQAS